jgi:hypothetical protein
VHPFENVEFFSKHTLTSRRFIKLGCNPNIDEYIITCKSCGWKYAVNIFNYNISDIKQKLDCYNKIKLLMGITEEPINKDANGKTPILINILDKYFGLIYGKLRNTEFNLLVELLGTFLLFLPLTLLFFVPLVILYYMSKGQMAGASSIAIIFLSIELSSMATIVILRRLIKLLREFVTEIPVGFTDEYLKTGSFKLYKLTSLKELMFIEPRVRITLPTLTGLILISFYISAFIFNLFTNNQSLLNSLSYGIFVALIVYSLLISFLINYVITLYIYGNVAIFSLITITRINEFVNKAPIRIDPFKKGSGAELYGEIILSSLYLGIIIIILSLFILVPLTTIISNLSITSIDSSVKSYMNLQGIINIVMLALYVLSILLIFIVPMINIRKQLRKAQEKLRNSLSSKLPTSITIHTNFSNIEADVIDKKDHMLNLLLKDKIDKMDVWPINVGFYATIWNLFKIFIMPLIALVLRYLLTGSIF